MELSDIDLIRINITARLTGAPPWVEKSDIELIFGRWGKVKTSHRGTSISVCLTLLELREYGDQAGCGITSG